MTKMNFIRMIDRNTKLTWHTTGIIEGAKADLEHVDFKCNFKPNGKCASKGWNTRARGCCCHFCGTNGGYFESNLVSKEQAEWLKENFNGAWGFFVKGKGCSIPRKWRSRTCSTYCCQLTYKDDRVAMTLIETVKRLILKMEQYQLLINRQK